MRFQLSLARELGMTRWQLLNSMDSAEYTLWVAYAIVEGDEAMKRSLGKDAVTKLSRRVAERDARNVEGRRRGRTNNR